MGSGWFENILETAETVEIVKGFERRREGSLTVQKNRRVQSKRSERD